MANLAFILSPGESDPSATRSVAGQSTPSATRPPGAPRWRRRPEPRERDAVPLPHRAEQLEALLGDHLLADSGTVQDRRQVAGSAVGQKSIGELLLSDGAGEELRGGVAR